MRFYCVALRLKLKELLRNKAYMVVLIILPILMSLIVSYGKAYIDEGSLKAGLWSDSILGNRISDILLEDKGINFTKYDTVEILEKAVATNEVECGFVIKPIIDEQKENMSFEKAITVITSPATMAQGPLQEVVTATIYRLVAEDIAYMTLKGKSYMQVEIDLKNWIHQQVEDYYADGELMQIVFVQGDSKVIGATVQKREGILRIAKGLMAIFLMMSSLLMGVRLIEDRKGKIYSRFCTIGKGKLNPDLPLVGAHISLQTIVGILALIIIKLSGKEIIYLDLGEEVGLLIAYILCLAALVLLVSELVSSSELWFSMIPICIIAAILFCPIVVDMSSMQTWFKYLSYLMVPYYYLGGTTYLLGLVSATIVFTLIYYVVTRLKILRSSDDILYK